MNKQRKVKEKYTPGSKVLTVFLHRALPRLGHTSH